MKDKLLENFIRISKIPRASGDEKAISDFFVSVAIENNLEYYQDENKNVLIKKPGSKKKETLGLQAHLDMVCVKTSGSNHNFKTDGIEVLVEGDKVTAKDTSLGADQGVGLAIMLTILEDKDLPHPDLEFIFTVEEETTFKGVVTFPYELLKSRRIINLDNSKDNSIFSSADGDICNEYSLTGKLENSHIPTYKVTLTNQTGGNSGENIELSASNAITTMAKLLENKDLKISSINGGTTEIDIATTCEVILATNNINSVFQENSNNLTLEEVKPAKFFSKETTTCIINQILRLKSGWLSTNASANLGTIKTTDEVVTIKYLLRSNNEEELNNISKESMSLPNNFKVTRLYNDPFWKSKTSSELLKKYSLIYFNNYHEYPKIETCHGGMECASINKRIKDLDIISIGANMEHFHTTNEVTYLSSWLKVYNCLISLLEEI